MSNSQLQQASPDAAQEFTITNDLDALCKVLSEINNNSKDLGLQKSELQELAAEINTILSQSKSPKPKSSIIRESLSTIRTVLEAAAGNVVANGFLIELGRFV